MGVVDYLTGKIPLFIGTLLVIASSFYEVFSNYIDALKAMFDLTQSEVEWLGTAKMAAALTSVIAGIVQDNKGALVSLLTGMITWSAGVIVLGWSVYMVNVIDIPFYLLCVGIILWAHGRTYLFITGMVTLLHAIPSYYRHAGSAFIGLAVNIGALLNVLIYEHFFVNGHVLDAENQNFLGFLVMQFFVGVITNAVSIFGLFRCSHPGSRFGCSKSESECEPYIDNGKHGNATYMSLINPANRDPAYGSNNVSGVQVTESNTRSIIDIIGKKSEIIPGAKISEGEITEDHSPLCENLGIEFLLFLVTMTLVDAVTLFFSLHITIFTKSLGFSLYNSELITIYRASVAATLILGLALMWFIRKWYLTVVILQIGNLFSLLAYIGITCDPTHVWTLYFAAVLQGICFGLIMSIFPSMVENFSSRYVGTLFGIITTCVVVILLIIQPIFGAIYSAQIFDDSDSNYCYGPECLRTTFLILVGVCVLSNVVCIVFMFYKCKSEWTNRSNVGTVSGLRIGGTEVQ